MDIKEVKEVASFICEAVNGVDKSMADGKVSLGDAMNVVPAMLALPAAIGGIKSIPAELKDFDPAEAEEFKAHVAAKLDLSNDAAEAVAEEVMGVIAQLGAAAAALVQAKAAAQPAPVV